MEKRLLAIMVGIFVTLLWSSSYFVNKVAFEEGVGPITLAGMRYTVAALVLVLLSTKRNKNKSLERLSIKQTILLGLTGYMMGQGLQYAGQFYLSPTQTSLLLNIGNTTLVAIVASIAIKERLKLVTWVGMFGVMVGAGSYYYPWDLGREDILGIIFVLLSSLGYAIHLTWTRHLLKDQQRSPKELVMKPMMIGAVGMFVVGLSVEGLPVITWKLLMIILWLGILNGSIAFTLWTWSQKHLEAFQSSIINNLMLIEIALFEFLLLDKTFSLLQTTGLLIVFLTILIVQLLPIYTNKRKRKVAAL